MITRRELLAVLGGCLLAAPFGSFAQAQGKGRRIGFLWETQHAVAVQRFDAFKTGMRALGYAEGRDYTIEQRSAQGDVTRLPALAAELVALKVDVIVTPTTPTAVAARKATRDIPILLVYVSDPVRSGLAATLSRPGGNVTGFSVGVGSELISKRLDLLREIVPGMRRVGFLYNPDSATSVLDFEYFESSCAKLTFKAIAAPVRRPDDVAAAFDTLKQEKAQGVVVPGGGPNNTSLESIVQHAAKQRLPAIYPFNNWASAGGLVSYGLDTLDLYRRAAGYADKLFKGAKPGDLPIEQPAKFELVINMKTAKALDIAIPQSILLRTDRVIE